MAVIIVNPVTLMAQLIHIWPAAFVLSAGLEGIRKQLDPGKPNKDNLYELTEAECQTQGIKFLPQILQEAVQAFTDDPLMEKTLGK